jgi:hypothetical protein
MTDEEPYARIAGLDAEGYEIQVLRIAQSIDRAHEYLQTQAERIDNGITSLIECLELGIATPKVQEILADFLRGVRSRGDFATMKAVLGQYEPPRKGAPRKEKEYLWYLAESTYEHFIAEGHSEEVALKEAWLAYYPDKDYEVESKRPAGTNTTAYLQQIEKFKVTLNKHGIREKPKRGRKPKKNSP